MDAFTPLIEKAFEQAQTAGKPARTSSECIALVARAVHADMLKRTNAMRFEIEQLKIRLESNEAEERRKAKPKPLKPSSEMKARRL